MPNEIRLLTYNIREGGAGRERLIEAIVGRCAPDLVILQEAVTPAVVERIAKNLRYPHWASRAGTSVAFLSRVPIESCGWHHPWFGRRAFLELRLAGAYQELHVYGVHLSAIHSNWTEARRVREIRALLARLRETRDAFQVVTGDFNTLAPGESLPVHRLPPRLRALMWLGGGQIRWRTIRAMLEAGYKDGFRQSHETAPGHTFPSWDPHIRLDYVFVSTTYVDRIAACDVITGDPMLPQASDHLPVLARLRW